MVFTANKLIADAYYMTDIVSREFDSVSGTQAELGLEALNELLDQKTVEQGMIPYISTYTGNFVIGQESYVIPNLINVNTLTFTLDDVRYNVTFAPADKYFGCARANDIRSLPYVWTLQKGKGGATLFVYYSPDQSYPFELKGLFRPEPVTQFQDLSTVFDPYYRKLLKYELAQALCDYFSVDIPQFVEKRLSQLREEINKNSQPIDMSGKKISTLTPNYSINYGYVNLGTGFFPDYGAS